MWWFRRKLNFEKGPQYHDQDSLKNFFYSLYFQWLLKFLEKIPSLAQKYCILQKTIIWQNSTFFKVIVWPKSKIQISANVEQLYFALLKQPTFFLFVSWLEKNALKWQKFPKISTVEDTGPKFSFLRQSWTKYLAQT